MASWIRFNEMRRSASGRTRIWHVVSLDGQLLGEVHWFSRWRKYAFFPHPGTVFEQDCLRELATFCERQTAEHKAPLGVST